MKITDTLKIERHDKFNVVILQLAEGVNPKNNEPTSKWKIEGYYTSAKHALQAIVTKDLLVDLDQTKTLSAYIEHIKTQNKLVLDAIEKVSVN